MNRFLEPARPALQHIAASLRTTKSGREAWHLLASRGDLPSDWANSPARRFVWDPGDPYQRGQPTRDPLYAPAGEHPSSPDECALYAADVKGIVTAETAARQLAERLAPWGAPACERILWWAIPKDHYQFASQDTRPGASFALMFASNMLWSIARADPLVKRLGDCFGHALDWAELWLRHANSGAVVGEDDNRFCPSLVGRELRDIPNPFESLAAIEATGYAALEYIGGVGAWRGSVPLVNPVG